MASRLDRLFVLLESGSNSGTRKAAAQQLGQVQRLHPHELPLLLNRVHKCLSSSSWETRIAAGQAVEAILSQLPVWEPNKHSDSDIKVKQEDGESELSISIIPSPSSSSSSHKLKFESFDVENLLKSSGAQLLMSSEGKVFDRETTESDSDPIKQRSLFNKRLGLDIAEKIGIDTTDIMSNEDFQEIKKADRDLNRSFSSGSNTPRVDGDFGFPEVEPNLSSREINLARRRARKQKSREASNENSSDQQLQSSSKKIKREESIPWDAGLGLEDGTDFYEKAKEEGRWPLEDWVQVLLQDLFSPVWEVRHGAGTALRVIVRLHGKGAGQKMYTPIEENENLHQEWLEDMSLRLVSVLALDRFGDFVTDQVVAPVRETTAQCLGTVISLMSSDRLKSLMAILVQLLKQSAWEVRHGGLLALKYMFAIRSDLVSDLLPPAFPSIFQRLSDPVDDVSSVAASALIPVTEQLVLSLPNEAPNVVNILWESLANLDDLSSACNSIMSLLATLLAFPAARNNLRGLDLLMPRLWPFLHHTSSSVRKSALLTLQKLTELDPTVAPMSVNPLQLTLRHTFQRALLEHIPEVLDLVPTVWSQLLKSSELNTLLQAACPMLGIWLYLSMHHPRLAIDPQHLVPLSKHYNDIKCSENDGSLNEKVFISGSADAHPVRVAKTRLSLAEMLGQLTPYIVQPLPPGTPGEQPLECFVRVILFHLNTRSSLQRTVASLVLSAWDKKSKKDISENGLENHASHPGLEKRLIECLIESVYFDEIAYGMTKLQSESRDFIATLKHYKVPPLPEWEIPGLFSFDQLLKLSGDNMVEMIQKYIKKSKIQETLLERRKSIWNLYLNTRSEFMSLSTTTLGSLSGAVVSLNCLPVKLSPVVKPLMESIRKEENELFQSRAASHLCQLINIVLSRTPCPIPKIIQNLTTFLCSDGDFTPPIDEQEGILALVQLNLGTGPAAAVFGANENHEAIPASKKCKVENPTALEEKKALIIQRRGATCALTSIVEFFGVDVPEKVWKLWDLTFGILQSVSVEEDQSEELRKVIDALQILETISPKFHSSLFVQIESQIGRICELLAHKTRAIRHMASRCLAVWACLMPEKAIPVVAKEVIPRLGGIESTVGRQGAIECLWSIVDKMGLDLLPYIVLLVVPVLGRMSDQDEAVRQLASLTFATLVRLMPLEGSVPDPPDLPKDLLQQKEEQRAFLEQLLNPTIIPEYKISVPINATLRPYQQAGVNWLGFLNKYKLHGILCDDMGLGKTLQSICILGSDHFNRSEAYKIEESPDNGPLPSIVICPPTLTGHWVYEIENFIDVKYLNPLHYHGPPTERNKLQGRISKHNLVVASYDIVRNDVEFFSGIHWNYCILDEGHMIKNGKTKISKAIKQIKANHRLILSGTPIQNNVLELWSLFDFLMPGFLGSEKQFSSRFGRPILLARDPKSSPKDQESGALAMEALHRQALPFLLRRLKEDVLQDLPPKITQDYYCELSPIQEQLYEDFARTRAHQSLRDTFSSSSDDSHKNTHIFQALQYLRKVCNHPKLVLTPQHPKYGSVMAHLSQHKTTLNDIKHSAKLPALKQLLLDCGIGVPTDLNEPVDVVNQHRALIFCQLKVMLDILENDLLKSHMPSVTYLRLDGSVPAGQRHSLVTRFNNDPSIDVLLLTTQVGGLGLNLTGADTVIFVEHDWNPMRDLQAMDRAHRIGQKKVVNVYRLITRGTLEEKIMGLQKFKLLTANTIISQDNSCIETMATDQLLDLFVLEDTTKKEGKKKDEDVGGIVGAYKNVLENISDLWDDKLYDDEYDLSAFIKNLAK